jgi:hypothetical protein
MAVEIVDLFEVVDVEDDGRQASVRGSGSRAHASVARSKKPRRLYNPVKGSVVASRISSRCMQAG